jgi:hypothetical protein
VRCNESWLPETALHTVGTQYFQAFGGYYPRR